MEYRAVGNRCAVVLDYLRLSLSHKEILAILSRKGFAVVEVDIIALARQCVGKSQYCRGAKLSEAPAIFDCSSFVKWLYAKKGVWLPRRSIQQRELGETVDLEELITGDLVFISGAIDYYQNDIQDGVGHVGIYTGEGTIVHAANKKDNIIESPLNKFIGETKFRGARRYLPMGKEIITLETPLNRGVEIADDIRWIVLQSLPAR